MAKRLLLCFLISLLLGVASPQGCAHGLDVKIYYSRPDLDGLYRKQEEELIPYKHTLGYRCVNPADWEAILNYVKTCKEER